MLGLIAAVLPQRIWERRRGMAGRPMSRRARLGLAITSAACCYLLASPPAAAHPAAADPAALTLASAEGYVFVCDDEGQGLSIVDVLQATGDHQTFLDLFSQYDPEGFAILSDPELADTTVWAPTDAAFSEVEAPVSELSDDEVKAILGYHITPPRRTQEGPYPIITPQFLTDGGEMVHQTRTGILTGSDQRLRTSVNDGVLTVQQSTILPTAWCTQAGSVFAIDQVITEASAPSPVERIIYVLFFRNPILTLFVLVAAAVGSVLFLVTRIRKRNRRIEPTN